MGEAFLKSVLGQKLFSSSGILICEKKEERCAQLRDKYGVQTTQDPLDLQNCAYLILAFKPQNLADIQFPTSSMIVITMLAGKTIASVKKKFLSTKVVRIMPNLGQFVGQGMTGVVFDSTASFTSQEEEIVKNILTSGGKILTLESEEKLDQLSTISGSGPAYFFLFAEQLVQTAKQYGFSEEEADLLVRQTFLGSAEIMRQNPEDSFALWRERVTSPKGTTEQALRVFQEADLQKIITEAAQSALDRTHELAQEES